MAFAIQTITPVPFDLCLYGKPPHMQPVTSNNVSLGERCKCLTQRTNLEACFCLTPLPPVFSFLPFKDTFLKFSSVLLKVTDYAWAVGPQGNTL